MFTKGFSKTAAWGFLGRLGGRSATTAQTALKAAQKPTAAATRLPTAAATTPAKTYKTPGLQNIPVRSQKYADMD